MDLTPYVDRLGKRAEGFITIFTLLQEHFDSESPLTIVETGCVRDLNNWEGDGNSTILFNLFAAETGSAFYSIDNNPGHCDLARRSCPKATMLCGDSVAMLHQLRSLVDVVDLLYLDSCDLDWSNPHPSALHHLKELCAAAPVLKPGSLVFADDNSGGIGKGMYVAEFLLNIGAQKVFEGYQVGFRMPHSIPNVLSQQ
jgi:hypothetical protein